MEINTDNNTLLAEQYLKKPEILTCTVCGHTGTDVKMYQNYIGGKGYITQPECTDVPSCRARLGWDTTYMRKQHPSLEVK
jgi:hypothetical protein